MLTFEREGIRTIRSIRSCSRRGRTSMFSEPPFAAVTTSVDPTGKPVDVASIETFFCCSSEAITLTRPFRLLTESETRSPVSISVLYIWARLSTDSALRHTKMAVIATKGLGEKRLRQENGAENIWYCIAIDL